MTRSKLARYVVSQVAVLTVCVIFGPLVWAQDKKDAKKESSPDAVALYADGANFQNNGAFELAAEEWAKFLVKFPDDPLAAKAQHYSGVCHVQLKQFDKAAAAFEALLKKHPSFELAEDAMLNLGWSQYSQASPQKPESYTSALASFGNLLQKFPKGKFVDQACFFQGECHYNQGKKKEAIAAYEQVVKNHDKSPLRCDAAYALGVTHEELGQFAEAGKVYDILLKDCSTSPLVTEVRMRKAETILQAGQFAEAEKAFAEVAAVVGFVSVDHALSRQAHCATKQNKFSEAAVLYAKIPAAFPQSTYLKEATLAAGRCFFRADKLDDAAGWFNKVIDGGSPDAPEAAHWLCRIHLRNKKPDQVVLLANKLLPAAAQSPFLVNLEMDRADALYELPNQRDASLAAYLKLVAEHAQHELAPQALYNVAFAALEAKKYDDGLKHAAAFLAAYKQDRLVADVKYTQAESQLQLGKHVEAEAGYRDLLTNYASHADIEAWRVRLGLVLYLQKKYADAIGTLTPLLARLKLPDNVAEAQYLIGASHFNADQFAEAAKAMTASIAANGKWRQADETLLLLSRSQRKLNQATEAKGTMQRLLAEFPQSKLLDQAHYRLGEYAFAADDFKAATAEYDEVIKKWPDSTFTPYALYGKGWSQLKSKEFAPAAESFTALLTKAPQHQLVPETQFARAMSRRQAGDNPGCIEDVNAYLKSNPDLAHKSDALYERGLAEVGAKNPAAAVITFAALLKENEKYPAADRALYELAWAYKTQDKHDDAVASFSKLATSFTDSPLVGEAHFHVGESQYEKKQFDEAIKSYAQAKAKTKEGELAEKSAYKMGWSHYQLKQYLPASEQFAAQLAASPKGSLALDAMFMKAECFFRLENYKDAWSAYNATVQAGMIPAKLEVLVLLHGGQAAGQLKLWPDSLKYLQQIPTKFADSPLVAEALYEMGFAKKSLNQPDEAVKEFEQAATKSRDHVGARARYMIGEILFEKKQFDEAIKQYQRVMFGYGGESATAEVKKWQSQAGYEAARCWEVQVPNAADAKRKAECLAEAKKTYGYVVEKHPQSNLVAEAKKRLEVLSKL